MSILNSMRSVAFAALGIAVLAFVAPKASAQAAAQSATSSYLGGDAKWYATWDAAKKVPEAATAKALVSPYTISN